MSHEQGVSMSSSSWRSSGAASGALPDPVPKELIDEIIGVKAQCPSSMNTPWYAHVVTGEAGPIRKGNTEQMITTGKPDREIRGHGRHEGDHRDRQNVAAQLFEAAGIGWDNKEQRQDWVMRGFRQFDAPVSVIGCIDRSRGLTEAYFDPVRVRHGAGRGDRGLAVSSTADHAVVGGAGRGQILDDR